MKNDLSKFIEDVINDNDSSKSIFSQYLRSKMRSTLNSKILDENKITTKDDTSSLDDLLQKSFDDKLPGKTRDKNLQQKHASKLSKIKTPRNTPTVNIDKLPSTSKDSEVEPSPPTKTTLPATRSNNLNAAGETGVDWLSVSELPGYMQAGIRQLGDLVFSTLTKTRLSDVNILANLNNSGPNTHQEINNVAHFTRKNAVKQFDLSMDFGDIIPGYSPDVKLYITTSNTYMLVRDDMGDYIYAWPTSDNIQSVHQVDPQIDNDTRPRLK